VPELPEVETVVRGLRSRLPGRRIVAVWSDGLPLRQSSSTAELAALVGRCFTSVRRRGKWILADLDQGRRLLIHLGMTGQLYVASPQEPRRPHTHLVLTLDSQQELRFRDVRRFGSVQYFPSEEAVQQFFQKRRLGPEPFDLEKEYWYAQLRKTRRRLKAVLLDQRVVAGVGNIYADEALFAARLSPAQWACRLRRAEAERLRRAVQQVLRRAIACRGSSIRDYLDGTGRRGRFQEEFAVYHRTGQPCRCCGTPIRCQRLAGRATHYCPRCQKQKASRVSPK
jgi:formamidopyrimidine-DNA glycosylase